jgi:hypothetical protein
MWIHMVPAYRIGASRSLARHKDGSRLVRRGSAFGRREPLTAEEQAALADLGYHWGDCYSISVSNGTWRASPVHDSSAVITAASAGMLREKIRLDYADWHPVQADRMST